MREPTKAKATKSRSQAEWERLSEEYEVGELTGKEFCLERKLNLHTFAKWRCKLKKNQGAKPLAKLEIPTFLEVPVPPMEDIGHAAGWHIALVLRCGRELKIGQKFELNQLRELIRLVESC